MNYRHIYHAGNFADVFKHLVLCALLKQFRLKDKPFCYIDSHAGIGLYDLNCDQAQRSPEYQHGIMKLLAADTVSPDFLEDLTIIKSFNDDSNLNYYPGSPLIAAYFLREQDSMILNELHDDDFLTLKKNTQHLAHVSCHKRDAYEFLPAILPPTIRRALILIDPPYEKLTEHTQLINSLKKCLKKFGTGAYLLWYPIVDDSHKKLLRQIKATLTQPIVNYEVMSPGKTSGLLGSGVAIINPPWNIDPTMQQIVDQLNVFL